MIKCDAMKLNPRGHVVAEGGPLQILSEAKLLFCELINREKLSPVAARFAVEAAIEVCKLGNRELSFSEYSAACDIAEKKAGFDWGEFLREFNVDLPGSTVGKDDGAPTGDRSVEVYVIKLWALWNLRHRNGAAYREHSRLEKLKEVYQCLRTST